jgi:hypothetical protein
MAQASSLEFAIGKYNKAKLYGTDGWRMATKDDWTNSEFQAALVEAHQKGKGWPLLENPLECNGGLRVAEGPVQINGGYVVEVGFNNFQQLNGVYPAMNLSTHAAWTANPPAPSNNWTVMAGNGFDCPCLFVKNEASAAVAFGGSRRSRRHKRSIRVKKQKKRTRKH